MRFITLVFSLALSLWASIVHAQLALDGTPVTGVGSGSTTLTSAAFTNSNAGSIVVALIGADWNNPSLGSVTSVACGALTFSKRVAKTFANANTSTDLEVWWAYAASALSAQACTATLTQNSIPNNPDCTAINVFAVKGFLGTAYHTNPWDSNASLDGQNTSTVSAAPSVSGISTTSTATLTFGVAASTSFSNTTPTPNSGYTNIALAPQGSCTQNMTVQSLYQVFSSAQSSITVGWSAPAFANWQMIADALAQGSAGGAVPNFRTLLGVGK